MAQEYVMVRITRHTRARLEQVRLSLWVAHEQGKLALDLDPRSRVSLDQVLEILCDERAAHAKRRTKAKRARAERRRAAQLPQLVGAEGVDRG